MNYCSWFFLLNFAWAVFSVHMHAALGAFASCCNQKTGTESTTLRLRRWGGGYCPNRDLNPLSLDPESNALTTGLCHLMGRAPGKIKRSRDLRGGRWSWTLTFAQKRSWVGRWSWAEQVGRLLLRVVQVVHQQRCNRHCLSDSVLHSSWKSNCTVHKSLGNGEGTPP